MVTSYSDILLTDDGDIDLSTDSVIFIDSNQLSLRQRLNIRFAVWQGEWKYNSTFGTPYKSYVGKPTTKSAMDAEIKRQIFKETDVVSINSFSSSLDRQARTYTCIAVISTREEDSLTYFLNLRDNFEYIIPNINVACKKIQRPLYLTSLPYPIYTEDSTQISFGISYGSMNLITDMYYDGMYRYDSEFSYYSPLTTTQTYYDNDNYYDDGNNSLYGKI